MRNQTVAVALVAGTACLVAGCVADEEGAGSEAPATAITVEASEFEFEPSSWTVPAGEVVTIDLENTGSVGHEWVIIQQGEELTTGADFAEGSVLFEVEATNPGTTTQQTFTIDEPGTYQVICGITGHFDAGMEGQLTVE